LRRNSYVDDLTESQTLAFIPGSISEGKSEDEIADRFDGDTALVKNWMDALKQLYFVVTNGYDELVITSDGKNFLEKFNSHR